MGLLPKIAAAQETLVVGSKAPPIKVAKWVKGTPVKSFEKGKVYVVEFWATWCGPCLASIPHLTELANEFKGKATFTGVSVWEEKNPTSDAYQQKVVDFVKEMGSKMDYNVAVDDRTGTMAKSWMAAAKQNGIPTAFVVGKDGNIAWIGHPMNGLDRVLDAVVNDSFDPKAEAKRYAEKLAQAEEMEKIYGAVSKKAMAGDHKGAVEELDKVTKAHPELAVNLVGTRFMLLIQADEAAAYAYGRELAAGILKDNASALNSIAWSIVDDEAKLKKPDYEAAVFIAEAAAKASEWKDGMILDTLAYAHYKKGDVKRALELQEKAVALCKADSKVAPEILKELQERLELFKKRAGG